MNAVGGPPAAVGSVARALQRWWRVPAWMRSWRVLRSVLTAWWYSVGGHDLRVAYYDARRAPGWVILGLIVVLWPVSGWSPWPVAAAAAGWWLLMVSTRGLYWGTRRWARRRLRPAIGLVAMVVLAVQAGVWGWLLAVGLWLIGAGLSDRWRARNRLLSWVLSAVARSARVERGELAVVRSQWDGWRLVSAEVSYSPVLRVEDESVRNHVASGVQWALRHVGGYRVTWPPGFAELTITADPPLPTIVDDHLWPELPGIPVGVTDEADADGTVDIVDAQTGEAIESLPLKMVNPQDSQKHFLVIGGTGAGKTNFTRGFIARGLRQGWFPGGVFIFDGKGSSDYIVFEGRQGVHCVAREPEEWQANLPVVSGMMRSRYEADAEYERGKRGKPSAPLYLVVLEEVQEMRSVLGKDVMDPFLRQVSRQIRASGGRLMVVTQRPDTDDAIPGAVRDMLEEVFILGFVSPTGARMVLAQDWKTVVDEYGAEPVIGRGMARLGGKLLRLQTLRLDSPREHPELEKFYPPKAGNGGPGGGEKPAPEGVPSNVIRWSPRPAQADQVDSEAPTAPGGIPRIGPDDPAAQTRSGPDGQQPGPTGPDTQRRRRTV